MCLTLTCDTFLVKKLKLFFVAWPKLIACRSADQNADLFSDLQTAADWKFRHLYTLQSVISQPSYASIVDRYSYFQRSLIRPDVPGLTD